MRHKNQILVNHHTTIIRDILLLILVIGGLLLATDFIFQKRMSHIDHQLEKVRNNEIN